MSHRLNGQQYQRCPYLGTKPRLLAKLPDLSTAGGYHARWSNVNAAAVQLRDPFSPAQHRPTSCGPLARRNGSGASRSSRPRRQGDIRLDTREEYGRGRPRDDLGLLLRRERPLKNLRSPASFCFGLWSGRRPTPDDVEL